MVTALEKATLSMRPPLFNQDTLEWSCIDPLRLHAGAQVEVLQADDRTVPARPKIPRNLSALPGHL